MLYMGRPGRDYILDLKILKGPITEDAIRSILNKKHSLRELHLETYKEYAKCIEKSPSDGLILECGAGVGFAEESIPNLVSSDIRYYSNIDVVLDATTLPVKNASTSVILMHNVFHHIPDVAAFLSEATRCLKNKGRVLISDEYPGIFARHIYKHVHFEAFDDQTDDWSFSSNDPLTDANGALAWIVFVRDLEKFNDRYQHLSLARFTTHTPFRYWLSGGMKRWSLLPKQLFRLATWFDELLIKISPRFGSFVYVELVKLESENI